MSAPYYAQETSSTRKSTQASYWTTNKMPMYEFRDTNSGDVFEKMMSISAREQYLTDNPHLEVVVGAVPLVRESGSMKPDQGFRDVLREVKSKTDHWRQMTRSTINTF
jgi:hypothetical protein